ncbi:hypothetical protein Scep_023786 [Stephania cephalantha]|uniref:Uncharacterized protein n=1 Tax=Stephania cephalantha TaxID=152367 RepID=A0AAP0EVB4_9MAGN
MVGDARLEQPGSSDGGSAAANGAAVPPSSGVARLRAEAATRLRQPPAERRQQRHGGGKQRMRGLRRDERRGGALSTGRMRDFDEIATTRWRGSIGKRVMVTVYLRYELLSGLCRYLPIECTLRALIRVRRYLIVGRGKEHSNIRNIRVRNVECKDRDSDLVMHEGKDMDMFRLEREFQHTSMGVWTTRIDSCYCHVRSDYYPSYLIEDGVFFAYEISEEPSSSRRSPACRGGIQPYRVRWGYGLGRVWPWAGMALGLHS